MRELGDESGREKGNLVLYKTKCNLLIESNEILLIWTQPVDVGLVEPHNQFLVSLRILLIYSCVLFLSKLHSIDGPVQHLVGQHAEHIS